MNASWSLRSCTTHSRTPKPPNGNPHVPGGELHGPLAGCYKIKLRQQGVRLVYSVEDDHLLVTVVAVDKREDGVVYESAMARLSAAAAALSKALRDKLKK